MRFGKIEMNPARNPAVLDTATWDPKSAWSLVSAVEDSHWNAVESAIRQGRPSLREGCTAYSGSCARYQASVYFLTRLPDGQHVFVELGPGGNEGVLGEPIGARRLGQGTHLAAYPTDADTVERYVSRMRPDKGPKPLGATPRLGVGSRMSTAAWPGVWQAMDKCNFSANPIQNSVREVAVLEDILAGRPPRTNYLANFGTLQEGHTGSTFEGLWVAGVVAFLCSSDADYMTGQTLNVDGGFEMN